MKTLGDVQVQRYSNPAAVGYLGVVRSVKSPGWVMFVDIDNRPSVFFTDERGEIVDPPTVAEPS